MISEATGWPWLRGPLQRLATQAAQVPVQMDGRFHLRLLGPPRLALGRLTLGQGQAKPGTSAALQRERQAARQGAGRPVRSCLTGLLGAEARLQGQGNSTAQILASLKGGFRVQLREGTLSHLATEAAGLDRAQALAVLVRGDAPLPLRCARLDFAVENGVAQTRPARCWTTPTARCALTASLPAHRNTGAARMLKAEGFFAADMPVLVTGTFSKPQIGLDGRALGAKAAAAAALAAIAAPIAALPPFIDVGDDDAGDPCADLPAAAASAVAPSPATSAAKPGAQPPSRATGGARTGG